MWGPIEISRFAPPKRFKMPSGPGHYFGRPASSCKWCAPQLLIFLMELSNWWSIYTKTHPFGIGDLNTENPKNACPSHSSHLGMAVDIFPIHKDGIRRNDTINVVTWQSDEYSTKHTLNLAYMVSVLVGRYPAIQILYNDPEVLAKIKSTPRITPDAVRKQRNPNVRLTEHDDHIHILLRGGIPYTKEELEKWLRGNLVPDLVALVEALLRSPQLLRTGSRDQEVKSLQTVLNHCGDTSHRALTEDGIFGPRTAERVREFQRLEGLIVDGIVGPKTKGALAAGRWIG